MIELPPNRSVTELSDAELLKEVELLDRDVRTHVATRAFDVAWFARLRALQKEMLRRVNEMLAEELADGGM